MKAVSNFFKAFAKAFHEFINDNGLKLAASLAYYTLFSIGPLMMIGISLAGFFLGKDAVEGKLYFQLSGLIGKSSALQLQEIVKDSLIQQSNRVMTIVGTVILIVGATGVFLDLQDSLNYIWSVKAKPHRGWIRYLTNRLVSFSLIVSFGFLLMVSLLANTLMDILTESLKRYFNDVAVYFFYTANILLVIFILTIFFLLILKVLPDVIIRWRDAWVGAVFTAVLFMLGKFLIGFYMGNSHVGIYYGTAASVIIILLWVYYSSVILYFGAEFTKVYASHYGGGIKPMHHAVFILKQESAELPHVAEKIPPPEK